jgi:hypothetical protein
MRRVVIVGIAAVLAGASAPAAGAVRSAVSSPASGRAHARVKVLRVGRFHGHRGQYRSIQAAVNAAKPHDWILIGPGDYKTRSSKAPAGKATSPAGVLITTPHLNLRGMNRNKVIVDGTRSGPPCSTAKRNQNFGPKRKGAPTGLNGIEVWQTPGVRVHNLTSCNFLGSTSAGNGNEIWWNGGDDSGKIGAGRGFTGSYLTATSTYYHGEGTAAQYGIFSSNWIGGTWNHSYASNFNDSGYYIGACRQQCNQTVNHAWAEYNALGYSGSNSGGQLVIKHSQFDHNEDGFDTNSQNGDNPPPQNGTCPHGGTSPITHTHSCWVFMHNYVHDNNDPNVPTAGSAEAGPVGTGLSLSGGRNDTIMNNVFKRNNAWGVIFVPYPDSGPPCTGGTQTGAACLYDESGDALIHNTFGHNGSYGNPTNGDFAATNLEAGPTDCYRGNHEVGGGSVTSSPSNLETMYPKCDGSSVPPNTNSPFLDEVACDSGADIGPAMGRSACPPGAHYPRQTKVVMHPLPGAHRAKGRSALEHPSSTFLGTMANPCKGVPTNPWCPAHHHHRHATAGHSQHIARARVVADSRTSGPSGAAWSPGWLLAPMLGLTALPLSRRALRSRRKRR